MTTDELPRHLQLLWGVEPEGRRGPKPSLSIESIGDAAVELADEGGLDAVSMKAVADRVGMTTMSLYRYLDAKEDLYAVMLDRAYGPPPMGLASRGGWRSRLEAWARAIAARLLEHPWVVAVPMSEPPTTPRVLAWTDCGLRALSTTRLTAQERLSSLLVVDGFVRHHVQQTIQLGLLGARDETPGHDWPGSAMRLVTRDRYPYLSEAALAALSDTDGDFFTEELEFGLRVVLDGIAALVTRRAP